MAEVQEITLTNIKQVKAVLKKLSNGWVKLLAAKMFPGEPEEKASDKIYNIVNGVSGRDQETRILFINKANELKGELEAEQQGAINTLNNIIN